MVKRDKDAPVDWAEMEQKLANKLGLVITQYENLKTNKMIKVSKITAAKFTRTWNGNYGEIHYYELTLENGDKGDIGVKVKDDPKISIGETINYTIEQKGEYRGQPVYTIKLAAAPTIAGTFGGNKGGGNSKETDDRIARSVAIREAVALHVGLGLSALPYDVVNTAMYFEHYIATGINLHEDGATDAKNKDREDSPF